MTSNSPVAPETDRRSDIPLLFLRGSITVPLFGGGAYVIFLDMATSMKMTIALSGAAVALPMAALMAFIVARPTLRGPSERDRVTTRRTR